jgi:hypothetical protein
MSLHYSDAHRTCSVGSAALIAGCAASTVVLTTLETTGAAALYAWSTTGAATSMPYQT